MDPNYRVTFRGDPISLEAAQALDAAGLVLRASHGAGVAAPVAPLPEPNSHSVYLYATSADEALERVKRAVEDHGTYVAFEVEPFDVDASEPVEEPQPAPITLQLSATAEVSAALELRTGLRLSDHSRDWKRRFTEANFELDRLLAPRTDELDGEAVYAAQRELGSFYIQAYHIKDALLADAKSHRIDRRTIENMISVDADLALLADLANLEKHVKLDQPRSGTVPTVSGAGGMPVGTKDGAWRLEMVISHGGNTLDGLDVAKAAMAAWERHLMAWGLI
jgi:hypothetical protein